MTYRTLLNRLVFTVLLLVTVIVLGVLGLGLSATGTRLITEAVNRFDTRIHIEFEGGHLFEATFSRVQWQDQNIQVAIDHLQWHLDARCLLRDRLCIDRLYAKDIAIALSSAQTTGGSFDGTATTLLLPDIQLNALQIDRLEVTAGERPAETITMLNARGDFSNNRVRIGSMSFAHEQAEASLSGKMSLAADFPLTVSADLTTPELGTVGIHLMGDLNRLRFEVANTNSPRLTASGQLNLLSTPLQLELNAQLLQPWSLQQDAVDVIQIDRAELHAQGPLDAIAITANAEINSPETGVGSVYADLTYTGQAVQIKSLQFNSTAGSASLQGDLNAASELDVTLVLASFCPHSLRQRMACELTGPVRMTAALAEGAGELILNAQLNGLFGQLPGLIDISLRRSAQGIIQLNEATVASGPNSLTVVGTVGPELDIDVRADIPSLSATLPFASGTAFGKLQVKGTRAEPKVDFVFEAQDILINDLEVDYLSLALNGAADRNHFEARFGNALMNSQLSCDGKLAQQMQWQLRCLAPNVQLAGSQPWQFDEPLSIAIDPATAGIRVDPFCVRAEDSSVCSDTGIQLADRTTPMSFTARGIPAYWLIADTDDHQIRGELDLTARLEPDGKDELSLSATVQAPLIELVTFTAGEDIAIGLQNLQGSLTADMQQAELLMQAEAVSGGSMILRSTIDLKNASHPLDGQMELLDINLAPLALASEDVLSARGVIGGIISISGSLDTPLIDGRLRLDDGYLAHEQLPRALQDIQLTMMLSETMAQIEGDFSNGESNGVVSGTFDWSEPDWLARLRFSSERLRLTPLPDSHLIIVPELHLILNAEQAMLSGTVTIPEADIQLDRLPRSARSRSTDAVIVGQEDSELRFDYELDVGIALGEQVVVQGLGVRAELDGALRLSRALNRPLALTGDIRVRSGRYTAWGQDLRVKRGKFAFTGDPSRPAIDLIAVRDVDDSAVEVGVQVRGDASEPSVEIFSRPSMDPNRAMYYLLTGNAPSDDRGLELAVASLLLQAGTLGATQAGGALLSKVGVDAFSVGARESDGGTDVELSGYLTPDLYLRYGISTFDKLQTLRIRYRLGQSLFLEAVSGVEDAIDLLYSFER